MQIKHFRQNFLAFRVNDALLCLLEVWWGQGKKLDLSGKKNARERVKERMRASRAYCVDQRGAEIQVMTNFLGATVGWGTDLNRPKG